MAPLLTSTAAFLWDYLDITLSLLHLESAIDSSDNHVDHHRLTTCIISGTGHTTFIHSNARENYRSSRTILAWALLSSISASGVEAQARLCFASGKYPARSRIILSRRLNYALTARHRTLVGVS